MNVTFTVASLFVCDELSEYGKLVGVYDPIWRQADVGCRILRLLQDMYGFNVTYVLGDGPPNITIVGPDERITQYGNQSIDIFLRPMSLSVQTLNNMYPIQAVYNWRLGFLLRQANNDLYHTFYGKPFSYTVWNCIYGMTIITSVFLYFLKKWEFGIVAGGEFSYPYEILMVIGAYCQHIPPIDATLPSRRIAYFIFFMFTYTIYTFYTSNLLSHLVNDKKIILSLETLAATDLELVIVDYMKLKLVHNMSAHSHNYSIIVEKLRHLRAVSVIEGIMGMKEGKMALLSDYTSLFPYVNAFTLEQLCDVYAIDLYSKIQKYFFVTKKFLYREQFKIGAMRAREAGLLKRYISLTVPKCQKSNLVQTTLEQISAPLSILSCAYVVSVLILLVEKIHYKKNKIWPYVN